MIELFFQSLGIILVPKYLLVMFACVFMGVIFGILPGLGGMTYLAIIIPFTFEMHPLMAIVVLLAGHSVTHTSGGITSILLNVPGTSVNAPTLLDGYPMAQQGHAGRAIGNAVTASSVGGVFGAIILLLFIPILRPLVMYMGSPELFLLCVLGITFIATLSSEFIIKGMIAACLGLIFSLIGIDVVTGASRITFGSMYLTEGFKMVPALLGMFALPEILKMMVKGQTVATVNAIQTGTSDTWQGIKDVFVHWWLLLRASAIGVFVGIVPGIGSEVAVWVCYAHAKQTSKHPELFGHGAVEGIIAPESANNSKEGGGLIPTLGFGIPGSAGMAVLMGGLLIIGIVPGPRFLNEHLDLCFSMVIILVTSNIMAAILCLLAARHLAKVAFIPSRILAPVILGVLVLGTYVYRTNIYDITALLFFGVIGYLMARFNFPRPPFILAFILANLAENYLHLALKTVGPMFYKRPASLILFCFLVFAFVYPVIKNIYAKRKRT
ncbi:tripartite tricarboxylate transporter permease [Thermodesulfobacteriota bacterium]